jgi:hypothetical protein
VKLARTAAVLLGIILCALKTFSYSVLTHEEIVDLLWASHMLPLIQQRFPGLTDQQIKEAHAYAYGGSVIQDLGYYPFGSRQFSDLVHYVRSGDFVSEMVKQSRDPKEYAFALGALAHYIADVDGHPAVNKAVALHYPKLRARFGPIVTYEDDKAAHLKTEFGFDVSQVAKHRYASEDYHDFIGFEVSEDLLERVFPVVYGVDLKDVLAHEDLAVGTYRWAISRLIPHMTDVALAIHGKEIVNETPNFQKRKFLYRLRRADYEKAWGKQYKKPGLGTRFLAALLSILPKIGPFKGLEFNVPSMQTEDLYIASINKTFDDCRALLMDIRVAEPELPDRDLDTGELTKPAEYTLADNAYAHLLVQLADKKFAQTSPALRDNILRFYATAVAPAKPKKNEPNWERVTAALDQLKAMPPAQTEIANPSE